MIKKVSQCICQEKHRRCRRYFRVSRKEGKEKKKLDTLNCGVGTRVQRRENVGGSLNLWSPRDVFTSVIGFVPLTI